MEQANLSIDDYIADTGPELKRNPELILVENYLANFYRSIEEGSINIKKPEGKELCLQVINYFKERGDDKKIEEFYSDLANCTQSRAEYVLQETLCAMGTISVIWGSLGFFYSITPKIREDVRKDFHDRRVKKIKNQFRHIGIKN